MQPILLALLAALLFGASTPASKVLLGEIPPLALAGLLYLGAALGTAPLALRDRARKPRTAARKRDLGALALAVVFGGVIGPVLMLLGLRSVDGGSVALLLNLELIATAVLGVVWFREHLGVQGWAGVVLGLLSAGLLSARSGSPGLLAGGLVGLACVAWAVDNHVTALIDGFSPAQTTMWKGLVAGSTNLLLAFAFEGSRASPGLVLAALALGAVSYGFSIALYIVAAQHVGATRAQVVFASAPFLGAGLSFAFLGEPLTWFHLAAAFGLLAGVTLLFLGRHEHLHVHEACEHVHSHRHDDGHHDHSHPGLPPWKRHTHLHRHSRMEHSHRHLPDLHHRHEH